MGTRDVQTIVKKRRVKYTSVTKASIESPLPLPRLFCRYGKYVYPRAGLIPLWLLAGLMKIVRQREGGIFRIIHAWADVWTVYETKTPKSLFCLFEAAAPVCAQTRRSGRSKGPFA